MTNNCTVMNASQAYDTLNVDATASIEEIKDAYRKLALELHPDKNKIDEDDKKFKKVTEAYHLLKKEYKEYTPLKEKSHTYSEPKSKKKRDFVNTQWGAPPWDSPPEQDWSKFTRDFEDENPNFWKAYEKKFWEDYEAHINADGRNGEFEKTKEPKIQPDLLVDVDPTLCIGCCSCEIIAPEVFQIDKLSKMNPKSRVINVKGAGFNKIMNAAETCPTKAIRVDNKNTKERLYPI